MFRMKVIEAALRPKSVKSLIKRYATTHSSTISKHNVDTNKDDDDEFNKPIQFSTSKAATYPANGLTFDHPRYQGMIVSMAVTIFLVYFCILREENDIDEKLTNTMDPEIQEFLYGLKKQQDKARAEYWKTV